MYVLTMTLWLRQLGNHASCMTINLIELELNYLCKPAASKIFDEADIFSEKMLCFTEKNLQKLFGYIFLITYN